MLFLGTIVKRTLLGLFSFFCLFQYGRTALHLAANNGILDVVRYLCLSGANVEALTSVSSHKGTRGKGSPGNCISTRHAALELQLPQCSSVSVCPHKPRLISSYCCILSSQQAGCRDSPLFSTGLFIPRRTQQRRCLCY